MTALPEALGGLRDERIWVAWDNVKGRKVPKSPSGGNARSNDPSTWGTYDQAVDLAARRGYTGVGIMLGNGLGGVDLDGAVEDGEIAPWARGIIDEFGSYAEVSPSGTGVHVLFWADAEKTGAIGRANHSKGVEIYNYGRYFTVTGDQVGSFDVVDATDVAREFVEREFSGGSPDATVASAVARLTADQVKRAANKTMEGNCARDGVRYARVPQGRETCGFCYMLASRGFVYHTERTAGEIDHYHLSCDCKIVPGFADTEVDGYDPDAMYEVYSEARAKAGKFPETRDIVRELDKILEGRDQEAAERDGERSPRGGLLRDGSGKSGFSLKSLRSSLKKGGKQGGEPEKVSNFVSGVKRGNPMSFEDADGRKPNPFFGRGRPYDDNCQSCVVAYEARRRGFDVMAMPRFRSDRADELAYDTSLAWIDPATGRKPSPRRLAVAGTPKRLLDELEASVGRGERYHLGFDWDGFSSGHIVCIERDARGELLLYDPQSGDAVRGSKLLEYLRDVNLSIGGGKSAPDLLRVDNLELSKDYADGVLRSAT